MPAALDDYLRSHWRTPRVPAHLHGDARLAEASGGKGPRPPGGEQPVAIQAFLAFREQVAKLIAAGVLRPADATVVTQMLWGALHRLATLLITHPTFPGRITVL